MLVGPPSLINVKKSESFSIFRPYKHVKKGGLHRSIDQIGISLCNLLRNADTTY